MKLLCNNIIIMNLKLILIYYLLLNEIKNTLQAREYIVTGVADINDQRYGYDICHLTDGHQESCITSYAWKKFGKTRDNKFIPSFPPKTCYKDSCDNCFTGWATYAV